MGIRDRPISPRSPWQNGYSERLIGSIRRNCLDHVVVFGERHLRHLLNSYQKYYNEARTHLITVQGRADPTSRPARRSHTARANLGRTTPPICSSLSFRQGHPSIAWSVQAPTKHALTINLDRQGATYRRRCWPAPNLHFGSLSARIPSLWISGVLANRSPALAFSISAAAT